MGCDVSPGEPAKAVSAMIYCVDFGYRGSYFLMREHHDCLIILIGLFVQIDRMERPVHYLTGQGSILRSCWISEIFVERASDHRAASGPHVGVDHCCAEVAMAEQFLNGADVVAVFEQVGCERMAERVTAPVLWNSGTEDRGFDGTLEDALVDMVAAFASAV